MLGRCPLPEQHSRLSLAVKGRDIKGFAID